MVQEGGDEAGYEAKSDGERRWQENTWFSDCASLVQMLPSQNLCTASLYYDGIPDSIIQDFVGVSVVSEPEG